MKNGASSIIHIGEFLIGIPYVSNDSNPDLPICIFAKRHKYANPQILIWISIRIGEFQLGIPLCE